jgi:hypothetical protein
VADGKDRRADTAIDIDTLFRHARSTGFCLGRYVGSDRVYEGLFSIMSRFKHFQDPVHSRTKALRKPENVIMI